MNMESPASNLSKAFVNNFTIEFPALPNQNHQAPTQQVSNLKIYIKKAQVQPTARLPRNKDPNRIKLLKTRQTYFAILPGSEAISESDWNALILARLSLKAKQTASITFKSQDTMSLGHAIIRNLVFVEIQANFEDQLAKPIVTSSSHSINTTFRQESIRFYIYTPQGSTTETLQTINSSDRLPPPFACRHVVHLHASMPFINITTAYLESLYKNTKLTQAIFYPVFGLSLIVVEVQFKKEEFAIDAIRQTSLISIKFPGGQKAAQLKMSRAPKNSKAAVELQRIRTINEQRVALQESTETDEMEVEQGDLPDLLSIIIAYFRTSCYSLNQIIKLLFFIFLYFQSIIRIFYQLSFQKQEMITIMLGKYALINYVTSTDQGPDEANTKNQTILGHLNVNSIHSHKQAFRRTILAEFIKSELYDIFALTEHWNPSYKSLKAWISNSTLQHSHTIFSDHSSTNTNSPNYKGKGTALIVSFNISSHVCEIFNISGHLTAILINIKGKHTFIASIYMPSNDNKLSIEISNKIKMTLQCLPQHTNIILLGDFNTISQPIDHHQQKSPTNSNNLKFLEHLSNKGLIDSFRYLHPLKREYSFEKVSRIDYIFISGTLVPHLIESSIISSSLDPFQLQHHPLRLTLHLKLSRLELKYHINYHRTPKLILHDLPETTRLLFLKTLKESLEENNLHSSLALSKAMLPSRKPAKFIPQVYTKTHSPRYNKLNKYLLQLSRLEAKLKNEYYIFTIQDKKLITQCLTYWLASSDDEQPCSLHLDNPIKSLTWLLKEISFYLTTASTNSLYSRLKEIRTSSNENIAGMIKRVLERRTTFRGVSFLLEENTNQLTSKPSVINLQLYRFFSNLFKSNVTISIVLQPEWVEYYQPVTNNSTNDSCLYQPVSLPEIFVIIKSTTNNSSPGPDLISWAMLKLISEDHIFWTSLQHELNIILDTGVMPESWNKGITILLTKVDPFNGDQTKLRPICLLNTLRKIMTGIIDNRLKQYVESNHLLRDTNFGFRKGLSTSNSLYTIKSIIDVADRRKDPLYLLLLDIQKAYDTVPSEALKLALQRIGVSLKLISVILAINRSLEINIQHYYGKTSPFFQSNGLPQGDKYSPILWLIFYDPLLARLTKETSGYTLNNSLSLTHLAFADDLKLLSSSATDSKKQLVIVSSFLDSFQMKANASKSIVALNRHASIPTEHFRLQGQEMLTYVRPHEPVRILGAFLTLDGKQINTVKHAMKYFNVVMAQIYSHYTPGPLAVYLINMVVLPVLTYRLQVTFVAPSIIGKIDRKIRKLIRYKYQLPRETPSSLLYSINGGIKLQSFESILQRNLVTDSLVHIRSDNISSKVFRFTIEYFSAYAKLPESLVVCPLTYHQLQTLLPKTKRLPSRVPLVFALSNALAHQSLQLRTMSTHQTTNINRLMPLAQYPIYFSSWRALKVSKLEDICGLPDQQRIEQFFPDSKTTSFQDRYCRENYFVGTVSLDAYLRRTSHNPLDILQNDQQLNRLGRLFGNLIYGLYSRFIYPHNNLCITNTMQDTHDNSLTFEGFIPLLNTSRPEPIIQKPTAPLRLPSELSISTEPYNLINIYTDGSLIPSFRQLNDLPYIGAAAIFVHDYSSRWSAYGQKAVHKLGFHLPFLPICNPSSTSAEAMALQIALLNAPPDFDLQIYCDSTSAISSQQKIQQVGFHQLTSRELLKIPNSLIYQINYSLTRERSAAITYHHVKAHTNNTDQHSRYNDMADQVAKHHADPGMNNYELNEEVIDSLLDQIYYHQYNPYIPADIASDPSYTQLFSDGILVLEYPRKHIKKQFYIHQDRVLFKKLRLAYSNLFSPLTISIVIIPTDLDLKRLLHFTKARSDTSHFLDAAHIHEEKFRRNLILDQLPTQVRKFSWNNLKKSYAENEFCPFCLENSIRIKESFDHLWKCPFLQTKYSSIYSVTMTLLKNRYKIDNQTPFFLPLTVALQLKYNMGKLVKILFTNHSFVGFNHLRNAQTQALLPCILDCVFSAYYSIVWKPRSRLIHSGKDPPNFQASTSMAAAFEEPLTPTNDSSSSTSCRKRRSSFKELTCRYSPSSKKTRKSPEEIDLFGSFNSDSDSSDPDVNIIQTIKVSNTTSKRRITSVGPRKFPCLTNNRIIQEDTANYSKARKNTKSSFSDDEFSLNVGSSRKREKGKKVVYCSIGPTSSRLPARLQLQPPSYHQQNSGNWGIGGG
jgi:exonuclease III